MSAIASITRLKPACISTLFGAALLLGVSAQGHAFTSLESAVDAEAVSIGQTVIDVGPLREFYSAGQRLWTTDNSLTSSGEAMLLELQKLHADGLEPADYLALVPSYEDGNFTDREAIELELGISAAFLKAARDLFGGHTTPSIAAADIVIQRKTVDSTGLLNRLTAEEPLAVMASLRPRHPQYAQLRQLLSGYRSLVQRGGWPAVGEGPTLKVGMQDQRVVQLRANLEGRGYSGLGVADPTLLDAGLVNVIEHFQKRHGLDIDGAVGPATLAALNISAEERVDQLKVNLERWRWLPRNLGTRHVLVNQAGFELFLSEGGQITDQRRVIVGKPFHKTPIFSDEISYAEFNPTWTVPPSIAGQEMLPKLRQNPGYLEERGYKLYTSWKANAPAMSGYSVDWNSISEKRFPYRIVQQPSAKNALGLVKFIFPNEFNVYLHDTPSRQLFSRSARAFSHGCIRVHKPLEFAAKLFGPDQGLSKSSIDSIVGSKQTKRILMKTKVPVHLTYFTAWVDENGVPQFFNDVYKRDETVANILGGRV